MRLSLLTAGKLKRITAVLLVFCVILTLSSCLTESDAVLDSLGEYETYEFYSEGFFQDFTDYGKYYFKSVSLEGNEYFVQIDDGTLASLNLHLDDFDKWIALYREGDEIPEIVREYDFDRSIIDGEDYVYIYSKTFSEDDDTLASYNVYFLDVQSMVLYYFHNNI